MEPFEYRLRPKSNYMMNASWQELYKLTEYWKTELAFYADEIRFFKKLLSTYNYTKHPNLEKINLIVEDAETQLKSIQKQIEEHLRHIAKFIKMLDEGQKTDNEDYVFREEHDVLEDNISAFIDASRKLKKTVFTEVEQYINTT